MLWPALPHLKLVVVVVVVVVVAAAAGHHLSGRAV